MAIIAVSCLNGGVGKSTIAANLAAELAARGRTVKLLDTDPQKSLLGWANMGEGLLSRIVEAVDATSPERFKARIQEAARKADVVLIDTPPTMADPTLIACLLSDLVLLPVGPSPLDMVAAKEALSLAQEARTKRGNRKPAIRFVPSRVETQTTLGRDLPNALAELGDVFPSIRKGVAAAESPIAGLTVREHAPTANVQKDFEALAKAVERVLRA